MIFPDIKMTLARKKTAPSADLGNSPFSLRTHRRDACATNYYLFEGNLVLSSTIVKYLGSWG